MNISTRPLHSKTLLWVKGGGSFMRVFHITDARFVAAQLKNIFYTIWSVNVIFAKLLTKKKYIWIRANLMLSKTLFKLVKWQKQIYVIKTQTNIVVNVCQIIYLTSGSSKIYFTTISLNGYLKTYFLNKAEYFGLNRSTCWSCSIWIG